MVADEYESVHAERLSVSVEWFRRNQLPDYVEALGNVDVHERLADFIPLGSSEQEMRPVAEELAVDVVAAFAALRGRYGPAVPRSLTDLLDDSFEIAEGSEDLFVEVLAKLDRDRPRSAFDVLSYVPDFTALGTDRRVERQERLIADELELAARLRGLDAALAVATAEVRRVGRPTDVWPVLVVLAYLALVGIIVPVALLASRPLSDSLAERRIVFWLFASGLLLLLGYMGRAALRLRAEEPVHLDQPTSVERSIGAS